MINKDMTPGTATAEENIQTRKRPGRPAAPKVKKLTKRERSRMKIMHAAKVLFEEKGPEGVTFQMIADSAEMCRTTVFNHFSSLNDLIIALVAQEMVDLKEHCESMNLKGMELLYSLYDKLMEDTVNYPALTSFLILNAITEKNGESPVKMVEEMTLKALEDEGFEDPEDKAIVVEGIYYSLVNHGHVNDLEFNGEELKAKFHKLVSQITGR